MQAEPQLAVDEPIAWLRALGDDGDERCLPLFRRAARLAVGAGRGCEWRFDSAGLAERELVLAWDGIRLRVEEPARPLARATIGHGQSILAGDGGRLRIALELVSFDAEVTAITQLPPPPGDETTVPVPRLDDDGESRTVITEAPSPSPSTTSSPVAVAPSSSSPSSSPSGSAAPSPLAAPRPAEPPGRPWRVYLPPRNGAADDEPTAPWPLADALRPTADLLDRLGGHGARAILSRTPRGRLALYGALAVVVALEAFVMLRPRRPPPQPTAQAAAAAPHEAAPARRAAVMLPDKEVEVALHRAIAAYRAGKSGEAIAGFARLAEDTNDPAARTMLFILQSRGAQP